jgi:tetratricopeptide (TPR) repeat protein
MSLVNQVLNDLEKRGASTNIGDGTIRVVPLRKSYAIFWRIFALLLASVLLAMAWHKWSNEILQLIADEPAAQLAIASAVAAKPDTLAVEAASAAVSVAVSVVPVDVSAASQVDAVPGKPLVAIEKPPVKENPPAIVLPEIVAVSPNPATTTGTVQAITIKGAHFADDAKLILRTPKRNTVSKRQIVMQNDGQIIFNVNLSNRPGSWSVEVVNPSGHSSGQFAFTVQRVSAVASGDAQTKTAALAEPKSIREPAKPAPLAITKNGVSKKATQITPQQQAENEYRKAYALLQQGQAAAAISGFEATLQLDAGHVAARQALVRLLLENKRPADAERVLQEGLQHDPKQSSLALLLARMQVGRNELPQALETMEKSLPYAAKQADYQAFVAALLQRQNRHQEAIGYFQNALKLNPQSGVWLMGLGISLRGEQRNSEAREAFNRALEVHNLSAELQAFVTQQLKEL